MRVDLRGGHAGVPEQFLHGAHVRAALDQVRGKGMAQGVRMEWFGDAGPLPGYFDDCREMRLTRLLRNSARLSGILALERCSNSPRPALRYAVMARHA